jgi:hypothetical protein
MGHMPNQNMIVVATKSILGTLSQGSMAVPPTSMHSR